MKAYQERLVTLLKDTITLLCRNGLEYDQEFCVEGLLGVTLDKDKEVFLIPIKELITDKGVGTESMGLEEEKEKASDTDAELADSSTIKSESSRKRRRNKHHNRTGQGGIDDGGTNFDTGPAEWSASVNEPDDSRDSISNQDETPKKRRHRDPIDIKSEDVVVIKEEVDDVEFASAFQDSSLDSSVHNRDGNVDFFSQPGTSQGQLGFPMDQLQGGAGGVGMSGMMPGMSQEEGDGSWLQSPGDMSQQHSQDWQQQKHQLPCCRICGQTFTLLGNLKRHIKTVHTSQRYQCKICHKTYGRPDSLRIHMEERHKLQLSTGHTYHADCPNPSEGTVQTSSTERQNFPALPGEDKWQS